MNEKMERQKRIKNFEELFNAIEKMGNFYDIITGKHGVYSKKSFGSTNPDLVRKAIAKEEKWLESFYVKEK